MKKIILSVLMLALLIFPMKNSFAASTVNNSKQMHGIYQKPTQSWSEYFKEREGNIIRGALIGTAVIGVGVFLYMWGPSLSVFFKGLFLGAMENIGTIEPYVRGIYTEEYFGNTITPLHQTSNHFYYQDRGESFTAGDCGLFAVRRLVNHARIFRSF
ncbi:hypothetical protein [Candidatus Endomicrobiellum devescovinae]|jgi:hypothetical protein|uniref:hypothetical protein n=1 Tax=Candidatus Endomicrobiellum devescovinae TaxID=3242322 RepID=UPI002820AF3A|nr:hypothetical protein [Endomicrobium sp.]